MVFHIVVNPVSGNHLGKEVGEKVDTYLKVKHFETVLHFSSVEEGITEICNKITKSLQEEIVMIVVGGDGTVNEAINGLHHLDLVRLAFIPAGTGCDMLRDMSIDISFASLMKSVVKNEVLHTSAIGVVRYLDLGKKRKFHVSCGMGFDAEICHMVSISKAKKVLHEVHLGSLVYLLEAVKLLKKRDSFPVSIQVNGKEYAYEDCKFLSIHNHAYEGGGYKFAPSADFQDGILNMCVTYHITLVAFVRLFLKAKEGKHISYTQYTSQLESNMFEVKTTIPQWVHTDGETPYKSTHIQVEVLKDKLRWIV